MQSNLSDLVDNLSEINKKECKVCMERKKIKSECDFTGFKNNRLNYRCKECGTKWSELINKAIKKFPNTNKFCNGDLNKFVLLSRKGVYAYEDMDSWEKFDETTIANKEVFDSEQNLENITDKDYAHLQKVWEVFKIKNRGEYHDLYVKCDTLLLADVFEKFGGMCIKIYGLDPVHFVSPPVSAWQACLKKSEVKLELLTDIDMLLMIEEGIRGGICQAI